MKIDDDDLQDRSDVPWLREMVEENLIGLFSEDREDVARCSREIMLRAPSDPSVLEELIEALRTSIQCQNDDTQASAWITLILGEIGDPSAFPVLFLGLGSEDEVIQEAARDSLLKMGGPAVEALLEEMEEEPGPEFTDAGYRLLGFVGSLKDPTLRERAMDFLADRVEGEIAKPPGACRIESLFQASALLGDLRMVKIMEKILREKFKGKNAAIQDSWQMLLENSSGEPLVYETPPWVEEHRWLFEEDLESARVKRLGGPREEPEGDEPDLEPEEGEDRQLASLYWGLSSTLERRGRKPLDARRFIEDPRERDEEPEPTSEDDPEGEEDLDRESCQEDPSEDDGEEKS